jgi:multidrug efflux pump subunit AcrA (membrane-fusion protein)
VRVIGAFLLAGLLGLGIVPRWQKSAALRAAAQTENASAAVVSVVAPVRAPAGGDLTLPGGIEAIEQTAINARTSGYLRRRYVDIGSRVQAGQLLAEIDSPEVVQQLEQARADAARADAGLSQARAVLARTQAGVEQARADAAKAGATVEQARADVARTEAAHQQAQAETSRAQAGVSQGNAEVTRMGANVGQARAALAGSQAGLAQAKQDLAAKQAELVRDRANLQIAEKSWKRWEGLVREGAVSAQEADERRSQFEARQAEVHASESAVSATQARVEAVQASVEASRSDIEAAQASVGSSQATVQAAQAGVGSNEASVRAAQAAVTSGQANAAATLSAWRASRASVRAAERQVDAARSDVAAAAAAVRSSQANVRRYTVLQSFQRVVAPFAGVITARNVDNGTLITAGGPPASGDSAAASGNGAMRGGLFGIARTDTLRILVQVPQTFVNSVRPGQQARITLREFPRREFVGEVFRLAGALDSTSRTLLAEIRLRNPGNLLAPGMYADIQLAPVGVEQALRVPSNTLILGADGTRVATVTRERKVHLQSVQLGRDLGTEVEITNGLRGDEKLISNPTDDLVENTPVQVNAKAKR